MKEPFNPWTTYADHPKVDRRALPRIQREWNGERVCIRYIKRRGHTRQRTLMGYVWGRLTQPTEDHLVAVTDHNGAVTQIHYRRVQSVWNLSRTSES